MSPGDSFRLVATLTDSAGDTVPSTAYDEDGPLVLQWTTEAGVYHSLSDLLAVSETLKPAVSVMTALQASGAALDGSVLTVPAGAVWRPTTFRLTVSQAGTADTVSAAYTQGTNLPPRNGSCAVTPSNGTALQTGAVVP